MKVSFVERGVSGLAGVILQDGTNSYAITIRLWMLQDSS
jgi:hypothetical protein